MVVLYLLENVESPSVSIGEVIDAVRERMPACGLTDWELGDYIARSAIDAGFAVEFDAGVP